MGRKRQQRKQRQRRLRESAVAAAPATGSDQLEEATTGAVREVKDGTGSRREVTIIRSGWGSSGYYAREVLERDGPKVFGKGTHMYLNHPSASEEADRPERDLRDLAGVIDSTPKMVGEDLVAEVRVYEHWQPVINAIAEDIGVSIRAVGEYEMGEAEGRQGHLITKLTEGLSVDYVTQAGAGGKVGPLLESARRHPAMLKAIEEARNAGQWFEATIHRDFTLTADNMFGDGYLTRDERLALSSAIGDALDSFRGSLEKAAPGLYERDPYSGVSSAGAGVEEGKTVVETVKPSEEEDEMSDAEKQQLADLEETVTQLNSKVDDLNSKLSEATQAKERAEDALLRVRAEKVVADATTGEGDEKVSVYEGLPERAVIRVKEAALRGDLPTTEDGKLDEGKLTESAERAAKEEREYLASAGASHSPQVKGFGVSRSEESQVDEGKLAESFQRLGLGTDAAKVAAEGR